MRLLHSKLGIVVAVFMAAGTVISQAQQPAFQMPPSAPQVSYNAGQLSVTANNCTIGDVINAIKNALGAEIEGVPASSTERIFGQFGPASPQTVLGAFLAGSPYDFIVVGSGDEGVGPIQHIILSPRSNARSTPSYSAPANNNANNNNNNNPNPNNAGVSDQFSRVDPQWSVPQYVAPVPPPPVQNNNQPVMPGQMANGQNPYQNNNAQPGDQRTAPYRPQHYGALYSPSNPPPPPPYNPNAMNPNQPQ